MRWTDQLGESETGLGKGNEPGGVEAWGGRRHTNPRTQRRMLMMESAEQMPRLTQTTKL